MVADTFRRDHLGAYGNKWIHTPNLDKLAAESYRFERAYLASFPTLPNRCDVLTGRFSFIEYDWSPLPTNHPLLAQVLSAAGINTMMIADTPHLFQNGAAFDRGFEGFEWIRGQENDRWRTFPREPELPAPPEKLRNPDYTMKHYLRNVSARQNEEDYFPARTFRAAGRWLEENAGAPFFLYVDTFDPHEPWDPPPHYLALYESEYSGDHITYPRYYETSLYTEAEIKHMRALYAGEVTLVDAWLGYLMRRLEALGLLDDTVVIFTTDHGFLHGEHGLMGKAIIWEGHFANCPLYEEIAHIPLLIRLPRGARGLTLQGYVQPPDVSRTILDFLGVQAPASFQGKSLVPVLSGRYDGARLGAISAPSLAYDPNGGRPVTITLDDWALIYYGEQGAPLWRGLQFAVDALERPAFVPGGEVPPPELYNLAEDPHQEHNVYAERPEVAARLLEFFVQQCEALGMEEAYLRFRRQF